MTTSRTYVKSEVVGSSDKSVSDAIESRDCDSVAFAAQSRMVRGGRRSRKHSRQQGRQLPGHAEAGLEVRTKSVAKSPCALRACNLTASSRASIVDRWSALSGDVRLAPGSAGACRRTARRARADGDPATRSGGAEGARRPDGRGPGRVARHAGVGHRRRLGRHGPHDAPAAGRQGRRGHRRLREGQQSRPARLCAARRHPRLPRSRPLRRGGAAGARRRAALPRRERVAAAAVAGAERRRAHRRGARAVAHARRPARLARRAADGRRIRLPPRRQSCRCAKSLWRGGAAVGRQSRRAQRGGRRPARHGRALRRRGDRRHDAADRGATGRRHGALGRADPAARPGAPLRRHRCRTGETRCAAGLAAGGRQGAAPAPAARPPGGLARSRAHEGGDGRGRRAQRRRPLARLCRAGLRRCPALHAPARGGARCLQPHPGAVTQGRGRALCRLLRLRRARRFHGGLRHHRFAGQRRAGLALLSRRSDTPTQRRARLRRDDGGPGARLRQPARRGLGPPGAPVGHSTGQRQHAARALPGGERARLAAPRPDRSRDRRQPGAARYRQPHRPGRDGDQRLPLRRRATHGRRAAGALPREPGRRAGSRATSTPSAAGCSTSRSSPATRTAAAPTPRARRSCRRRGCTRRRSPTTGGCSRSATIPTPIRPRGSCSAAGPAAASNGASPG